MSAAWEVDVTVLQDDIDQGLPGSLTGCPIARAVRRETGCLASVVTGAMSLQEASGARWAGALPAEASEFVRAFDHDRPVQEFKFRAVLERTFR